MARPDVLLAQLNKDYPKLEQNVNKIVQYAFEQGWDNPRLLLQSDAWAFLAREVYEVTDNNLKGEQHIIAKNIEFIRLHFLGTWKFTRDIYRFDQESYEALAATTPQWSSENSALEIKNNLPTWSVYGELPSPIHDPHGEQTFGYFYQLDRRDEDSFYTLQIAADKTTKDEAVIMSDVKQKNLLTAAYLELRPGDSVTSAVARAALSTYDLMGEVADELPSQDHFVKAFANTLIPALALLFGICFYMPEEDSLPIVPPLKKTKGGIKYFAPQKTKIWNITAAGIAALGRE